MADAVIEAYLYAHHLVASCPWLSPLWEKLGRLYVSRLEEYRLTEQDMSECLDHYKAHRTTFSIPFRSWERLEKDQTHPTHDAQQLITLFGMYDHNFRHPILLEALAEISFDALNCAVIDEYLLASVGKRHLDAIWKEVTNYLNKDKNGDDTLRSIIDIFDEEEHIVWFVHGVFPKGSLSVLSGAPKAGKTSLARWLIVGLSKGTSWLDCDIPQPTKVAYFCCDDPKPLFRHVMQLAYQEVGLPEKEFRPEVQFSVNPSLLLKMLKNAAENGVEFFILDTLFDALNVKDTNDYAEMKPIMGTLNRFCRQHNVHILCIHHNNKTSRGGSQEGILGSQAIAGSSAHNITVWCEDDNDERAPRYIKSRNRYPDFLEGKSFRGEEFSVTQKGCTLSTKTPEQKKISKQVKMIVDIFGYVWGRKDPVSKQDIETNVRGTANIVRKMVVDLVEKDILVLNGKKYVVHSKYRDMAEDAWKEALLSYVESVSIPLNDPE